MVKKQVLVIGGGNDFATYEAYLEDLKNWEVSPERLRMRGWKENLRDTLGKSFDVLIPKMPNPSNCKYLEWKIVFEKIVPLLRKGAILVGHSQGGIFLAKYLSENDLPIKLGGLMLVAPPFSQSENIGSFTLTRSLENISKLCENIHLFQSTDDPLVPFSEAEMYMKELPAAKLHKFTDRGHFNTEKFPEIVKEIKKVK